MGNRRGTTVVTNLFDREQVAQAFREVIPDPREGLVTLAPSRGSQLTLVIAGDPDQTVEVGGWESSARIERPAAKWWKAPGDGSLQLELAVDTRLVGGPDMARRLEVLRLMGVARNGEPPPTIRVVGGHLPLAVWRTWVMAANGLTLGARVVQDGQHLRQDVNVTLEPYDPADPIAPVRLGRTRKGGKPRRRVIRSKKGDTIRAIALRQLGSISEWPAIRSWNPALKKIDPDAPLKTGTKVVLR